MANKHKGDFTATYRRAYLSSGFRDVLFPIEVALLLRVLPEAGFVLAEGISRTYPLRARLIVQADEVASKGDFRLALNTERGYIGIGGPTPELATNEFVELKSFVHQRLGVDMDAKAAFHEFLCSGSIRGSRNPLDTFASLSQPLGALSNLQSLLGEAVALFGVRLSPPQQDPNQPDWTEIHIEPMVEQATQLYSFDVVFRRRNATPVIEFAKSFGESLGQLIKYLEQA